MGPDVCVNASCGAGSAHQWKRGWPLRSGGFAKLCNKCGSAYENSAFCDKFHHQETGWRECSYCNKPIHCGCIVSRSLFEYLDFGGIGCVTCVKASELRLETGKQSTVLLKNTHWNLFLSTDIKMMSISVGDSYMQY